MKKVTVIIILTFVAFFYSYQPLLSKSKTYSIHMVSGLNIHNKIGPLSGSFAKPFTVKVSFPDGKKEKVSIDEMSYMTLIMLPELRFKVGKQSYSTYLYKVRLNNGRIGYSNADNEISFVFSNKQPFKGKLELYGYGYSGYRAPSRDTLLVVDIRDNSWKGEWEITAEDKRIAISNTNTCKEKVIEKDMEINEEYFKKFEEWERNNHLGRRCSRRKACMDDYNRCQVECDGKIGERYGGYYKCKAERCNPKCPEHCRMEEVPPPQKPKSPSPHVCGSPDLNIDKWFKDAIKNNDLKEINRLLSMYPGVLNSEENTPLHYAADLGNKKMVSLFLSKGIDINKKNKSGFTALHFASRDGHTDVVRLLVSKGADINAKTKKGWTPLILAAFNDNKEIGKLLIKNGADAVAMDEDRRSARDAAKEKGHDGWSEIIWNTPDENGQNIFHHCAAKQGRYTDRIISPRRKAVNNIIKHANEYSINARDKNGDTPLHLAIKSAFPEVARIYINAGADLSIKDKDGNTPLHLAAQKNYQTLSRNLLDAGADINEKNNDGDTPLHIAVANDYTTLVRNFLVFKPDVNARNNQGNGALHLAVFKLNDYVAELLVDKGADINAENNKGQTPLNLLEQHEYEGMINGIKKKKLIKWLENNGGR